MSKKATDPAIVWSHLKCQNIYPATSTHTDTVIENIARFEECAEMVNSATELSKQQLRIRRKRYELNKFTYEQITAGD